MRGFLDANVLIALPDPQHVRDGLGCFVTFDARVPISAVAGAKLKHLVSLIKA